MQESIICHHIVYWTIPQIDAQGRIMKEQHYALNLAELDPAVAERIEALLRGSSSPEGDPNDPRDVRTDPRITEYRHLFRPFIEVKRRSHDLCRFSAVLLPFDYAEYAHQQGEPRHHIHPSVRPLAGAG